ncbi:hypothetical protein KACC15558_02320 [Brevibacterium ammoniilyticum]|uniref:Uncharacterized protein n=1 Tax=Brevibacterium ammoniilyticum TaxID=1046555 RepID=A0ABP9TXS0_9MICO
MQAAIATVIFTQFEFFRSRRISSRDPGRTTPDWSDMDTPLTAAAGATVVDLLPASSMLRTLTSPLSPRQGPRANRRTLSVPGITAGALLEPVSQRTPMSSPACRGWHNWRHE